MRVFITVFISFWTLQLSAQLFEQVYSGKDFDFYRSENRVKVKRELRNATGSFLSNSSAMIGSGFVSSIDSKESKLTAQFFGQSASGLGDVLAVNLKFSGSTDGAFYSTRALARPTFSISPGLFILMGPGKWHLNEKDYLKLTKNPDIAFSQAKPIKTSYKWINFSGRIDNGDLKLFELKDNVFEQKRGILQTNSIALYYNILRSYNTNDYNLAGFKSSYFSLGVEWVRLSNLRSLSTIDANVQAVAADTSGASVNLYRDLGTGYITTAQSPFIHYNETVFKLHFMLETVTGWVISTAVNYHRPLSSEDDIRTPFFNEKRHEYWGFEGGIQYSASNKAGKPIANIGVYGDYNYTNLWNSWIVSLKTSIPISL